MSTKKRINTTMRRDELIDEGQQLEQELEQATTELEELRRTEVPGTVRDAQTITELESKLAGAEGANEELAESLRVAEARIETLVAASPEADKNDANDANDAESSPHERMRYGQARLAARHLQNYVATGNRSEVVRAESLLRALRRQMQ